MKLPFPRRFKAWLVATVSLTALALVSISPMLRTRAQSPPTTYTITDLGTLGGLESQAFAINSCGQVAGYATIAAGESKRPFFRPSSSLINLGVLSGDGRATSVNNSGYVVGYSPTNGSGNRAFIWHDDNGNNVSDVGELRQILPLGAVGSAEDINDNGRVAGWIDSAGDPNSTGGYAGFTWDSTQNPNFQLIGGGRSIKVYGINNAGTVVGEDSDNRVGFILRNGVFTDIVAFPGGNRSVAYAVSDGGHAVGAAAVDGNGDPTLHAFIWTDAGPNPGLKDLGTLPTKTRSIAYNVALVSNSVQVVGTSYSLAGASDGRAFVWQDINGDGDGDDLDDAGEMKDLTNSISPADASWTVLQQARSINSSGQIVGYGLKTNGETHAFLLTPANFTPSQCLPTVNVSVSPSAMNEDAAGSLTYTFTRSITTGSPLTVNFSVGGTADPSTDYSQTGAASFTPPTGTVTFASGSAIATVTVDPTTDPFVETDETVTLTTTAGAYNIGSPTSATATITNDESSTPTVSVTVSPSTAAEDGATNLVYTFTRSTIAASPLVVNFSTTGTAVANDYGISSAGSVTIPASMSSATVTVDPTIDTTDEPDETVVLTVTPDAAYTVAASPNNAATGTITDDDPAPTISIASVTAPEPTSGSTNFVFTVSLTNPSSTQINVNYATATAGASTPATGGAGCTAGVDYVDTAGTLQFAAGETSKQVNVPVCSDNSLEPDETFFVNLSGNSANSVLPANTKGTGTITPQAPVVFTEEGNVTFAVAVDSVTFARGPFRLTNDLNFSSDRLTRVILFTSALGLTDADLATPNLLSVHINGYASPLPIEHVGPFSFPFSPGFPAVNGSYIIVRLPADLPNPSPGPNNLTLTVKMGSASSNATLLSIKP